MKRDNRVKKEETKQEILVLDQGMDVDEMAGTRSICCYTAFFPFR